MKKILWFGIIFSVLTGCGGKKSAQDKPIVFVSILPQKYFVERIVGNTVRVEVMVQAGQSPTTYDPVPRQLSLLSGADLYFKVGVPFEDAWMERIRKMNPNLKIIDTGEGIKLRYMDRFEELFSDKIYTNTKDSQGVPDPHIWVAPSLVKKQILVMERALAKLNPSKRDFYYTNYIGFERDLSKLQGELREVLSHKKISKILVFHPSWGYLLDEFGIKQIPIETEGKSPSPAELSALIAYAKRENIHAIFVQKQFSTAEAEAVAQAINGKVVEMDPLAYDYMENFKDVIGKLESFGE